MKLQFASTISILFFYSAICSANQKVHYNVQTKINQPLEAIIEADTRHLGDFTLSPSRYLVGGTRGLTTVYCADNNTKITYERTTRCNKIYWQVTFEREAEQGISATQQQNYFFDNSQWILIEWDSFPRFVEEHQINVCINGQDCQPLAGYNELPSMWVWGRSPTPLKVLDFSINLYTDSFGDSIDKQRIFKELQPAFEYIASVFQKYKAFQSWNLVWLKRDVSGSLGGSAARRGFLVNYALYQGKPFARTVPALMKTSTHEFAHTVSDYRFALWVSESLAEYYTYKALLRTGHLKNDALTEWKLNWKEFQQANYGLYRIAQQVEQGNEESYRMFYVKGAAFWHELDKLLQQNRSSLDYFIPLLHVSDQFDTPISLSADFCREVISVIGHQAFDDVVGRYLQ